MGPCVLHLDQHSLRSQQIFVKVWLKILNANHHRGNSVETPPCSLQQPLDTELPMARMERLHKSHSHLQVSDCKGNFLQDPFVQNMQTMTFLSWFSFHIIAPVVLDKIINLSSLVMCFHNVWRRQREFKINALPSMKLFMAQHL